MHRGSKLRVCSVLTRQTLRAGPGEDQQPPLSRRGWDGTTAGLVLLISGGDGDRASGRGRMWEENQGSSDVWRPQKQIQKDKRGVSGRESSIQAPAAGI